MVFSIFKTNRPVHVLEASIRKCLQLKQTRKGVFHLISVHLGRFSFHIQTTRSRLQKTEYSRIFKVKHLST